MAHLWGQDSTTKRIDLEKVQEYDSWVSGPALLNRETKRRNVRDYSSKLAQIVLHSEMKHDSLLEKWKKLSQEEREIEFFASMKTMTDNGNEASQTRNELSILSLSCSSYIPSLADKGKRVLSLTEYQKLHFLE